MSRTELGTSANSAFPASARSGLRGSRRAAWGTRGTLAEIPHAGAELRFVDDALGGNGYSRS